MKFLGTLEPLAYAAFRIVVGFLFMCHGAQKLFGAFGGHQTLHPPLMLVAAIIEFGGGILVILGLVTRFAAFIGSGEMVIIKFRAQVTGRLVWERIVSEQLSHGR